MYLITYTGDGATTEFNFSFPYFQSADVHVSVNSVIQTSDACTIIPATDSRVDGKYTGGRVVLNAAPTVGAEIRIWRKIDLSRVIDYQPTLPINTDCLNADFNFMLEYLRDLYELDGDVANIENGLQFWIRFNTKLNNWAISANWRAKPICRILPNLRHTMKSQIRRNLSQSITHMICLHT